MPWSFFSGNSFHHPAIVNGNGDVWLANRLERGRSARVDGPVLIADSTHYDYGHVLLEVATRLAYLELCPAGTRVLTRQGIARSYSGLFDVMGVSADRLVTVEGPTFCEEVYFGDSLVDIKSFVSRAAWRSFERMGELAVRSSVATPERIYISRKGVARRPLVNEAEIERLFAAFGFTILAPETMPLEDQIKVFAGAKMIAGPRGSGLHNIVFSSPEARLLMLTFRKFILPIDPLLMRAHGTLAYAIGEETSRPRGKSYYHANWTIDPALVEGAIRSHFGL